MRLPTPLAVAAVGLLLLSACGKNENAPATAAGSAPASAGFPVTIEHKYGSATIPAEPKRVAVVGLVEQDALLAVGVVPVATTEWFGEHPGAVWPWAQDELAAAAKPAAAKPAATKPEVLKDVDGIQFEKVAAARPDLILAIYSGLSAEDYAKLAKIAPTVAQPKGGIDYGTAWQDLTRTVGTAVGRKEQADKAIAGVEARFATVRQEHPEFAGATAMMAMTWEGYYVYGPADPRGRLLTALGFTLPAGLADVTGKEFGANLSHERTDMLDTGALVWLVDAYDKDKAKVQADPLYAKLKVKTEGRDIYLENTELLGGATSFISVLSLPYLLDTLVPQLAAAADGNPATVVQRAPAR